MEDYGAPLYETLEETFPRGLMPDGLEMNIKHKIRRRLRDIGYRVLFPENEPWEDVVEVFATHSLEKIYKTFAANPWFWTVCWPSVVGAAAADFFPEAGSRAERRGIATDATAASLEGLLLSHALENSSNAVDALPEPAVRGLQLIGQSSLPSLPTRSLPEVSTSETSARAEPEEQLLSTPPKEPLVRRPPAGNWNPPPLPGFPASEDPAPPAGPPPGFASKPSAVAAPSFRAHGAATAPSTRPAARPAPAAASQGQKQDPWQAWREHGSSASRSRSTPAAFTQRPPAKAPPTSAACASSRAAPSAPAKAAPTRSKAPPASSASASPGAPAKAPPAKFARPAKAAPPAAPQHAMPVAAAAPAEAAPATTAAWLAVPAEAAPVASVPPVVSKAPPATMAYSGVPVVPSAPAKAAPVAVQAAPAFVAAKAPPAVAKAPPKSWTAPSKPVEQATFQPPARSAQPDPWLDGVSDPWLSGGTGHTARVAAPAPAVQQPAASAASGRLPPVVQSSTGPSTAPITASDSGSPDAGHCGKGAPPPACECGKRMAAMGTKPEAYGDSCVMCDACNRPCELDEVGSIFWHCADCQYDLCSRCASQQQPSLAPSFGGS